jgi:hypothetical protein
MNLHLVPYRKLRKVKANQLMTMLRKNRANAVSLLFIIGISIYSGISTTAFLITGLDIPAIWLACALAVWTGTREPRANLKQIYWGWGIGGVVAFISSLLSPMIGFFFHSKAAEIALIAFWTLLAMPVLGIICAIRGRQWWDNRDSRTGYGLVLFIILASFSPILSTWIAIYFQ